MITFFYMNNFVYIYITNKNKNMENIFTSEINSLIFYSKWSLEDLWFHYGCLQKEPNTENNKTLKIIIKAIKNK